MHDEFKVLSTFCADTNLCLLDAFEPQQLADVVSEQLQVTSLASDSDNAVHRPIVAIYRANESNGIRVCVSVFWNGVPNLYGVDDTA